MLWYIMATTIDNKKKTGEDEQAKAVSMKLTGATIQMEK